jgi:regulator of sirC expression with transglutaminase-like and TPR domain
MNYEWWYSRSDDELFQRGLAEFNLIAASGLQGAENLNLASYLQRIDNWATIVDDEMRRMWRLRDRNEYREFAEGQFRVLVMTTIIQRDIGVVYSPSCISGEYDARDSRNKFIHGPLSGHGGTCASLPFLYVAIGRRLGYPLYIVQAKQHLFVRWEGGSERFNVEVAGRGFLSHIDEHYREHPRRIQAFPQFLRNMSPREELACCIMERSRVLFDNLQFEEAAEAARYAAQLSTFYMGASLITQIARKIVGRLHELAHVRSGAPVLDKSLVKPRNRLEALAVRDACQHLRRQCTIRGLRPKSLPDLLFQQSAKGNCHV